VETQLQADQIEELENRIADLKARLPAHSIPPAMMIELDELEDQLAKLQADQLENEVET
jgi:polyhydroxyalkanoate synthesis regulator phasin